MQDIVALITPFNEQGNIDIEALKGLVHWHIEEGTEGLVLCGSTGEGALLTEEEKCAIFKVAALEGKGKIGLIANTGTCCTKESVSLTQKAKDLGMEGCLAIVPYYVRPTNKGCLLHFSEIAKVGLPLIAYHHPGRTGTKLSAEILKEICQIPNVIGIKEASGDLELAGQGFKFYSGDDVYAEKHFSLGALGSISITGNVVPKLWKEFVDQKKMSVELYQLCRAMVLETNPQCVKYAVSLLGKCQPFMRLPLIEPSLETKKTIREACQIVELTLR